VPQELQFKMDICTIAIIQMSMDYGYCIRLRPWHWSSLLQRRLHHSGRHLQSSKPPFDPSRWHVRPINQDTVRPMKLPCCCSNCLEHSSSSFALAIHQSTTIHVIRAGLKTHLFNQAYTNLFLELFVLRVNLLTYFQVIPISMSLNDLITTVCIILSLYNFSGTCCKEVTVCTDRA